MRNLKFKNRNNEPVIQVNKTTARKLFLAGKTITICAANMRPFSAWCYEFDLQRACYETMVADETGMKNMFNDRVASYTYYNCINTETGKYPVFYVKEGDILC